MPKPPAFATQFFKLITGRRFAEAERVFVKLKKKIRKNEWSRGYTQALNGMLLAKKSNADRYMFLSNINFSDKDELRKYRREFSKYTRDNLHGDYDRGFFSAWAHFLTFLLK